MAIVKTGYYCSSRAVKICVCVPAEWNYWSLMSFTAPSQVLDCSCYCNTRGHNESRRQRGIREQRSRGNHTLVLKSLSHDFREVRLLFKDPFRGCIFPSWLHVSDWSSGPKHFTIFSLNCWTVENHLIRETKHFSRAKSVRQTVDSTGKRRRRQKNSS